MTNTDKQPETLERVMNAKELAAQLDGCEYSEEVSDALALEAKAAGLVIVFGASDDLAEFRGAIYDEAYPSEGEPVRFDAEGVLPDWDQACEDEDDAEKYFKRKPGCSEIEAVWDDGSGVSWKYKTDIPHETFRVMEDGEVYCVGIVFAVADLKEPAHVV